MKVSLIQMNSQDDKVANLKTAETLVDQAVAADRPDMVSLPEYFPFLDDDRERRRQEAEDLPGGETYELLSDLARRHHVFVHGGSLIEAAGNRVYNTTVAFDREGRELARYRKIHRATFVIPDGTEYRESDSVEAGDEVVTFDAEDACVGCTICYDVRFPGLYQALADRGATVLMVPAAFTLLTGKDHWELLLRARAVETQSYVVASAQIGTYARGTRANYGHSLVVDPWGHVVAKAQDTVGFVTATMDLDYVKTVRGRMPVASHKVM